MSIPVSILEHGIVSRRKDTCFDYHGWPNIVRLDQDTLAVTASAFRMGHLCPFGKIAMYTSADEGATWSVPSILTDTRLDERSAGICRLDNGHLVMRYNTFDIRLWDGCEEAPSLKNTLNEAEYPVASAYIKSIPIAESEKMHGSFVVRSENGGRTWSDPVRVPVHQPHSPCVLKNGRILYVGKEMAYPQPVFRDKGLYAYASDDEGRSWSYVSQLPIPDKAENPNVLEPYAIQLKNGRILCLIRFQDHNNATPYENKFTVYKTTSDDDGKTWSKPEWLGVHGAPPHVIEHSSGALVCVYGRRIKPYGECAVISYDNGDTWSEEITLRDDGTSIDLGYPASAECRDGSILTVYYQALPEDRKCSILYTKWRLPEI